MANSGTDEILLGISKKLNVLIALTLRQLLNDKEFGKKDKRKQGAGEVVRSLASMGLDAESIATVTGSPLTSVRTLMTPSRRK